MTGPACDRCRRPPADGDLTPGRLGAWWCRSCSYPDPGDSPVPLPPPVPRGPIGLPCDGCGQELLLVRPGRTTCARCVRLDYPVPRSLRAPLDGGAVAGAGRVVLEARTCSACGEAKHGLADGRCLSCRLGGKEVAATSP